MWHRSNIKPKKCCKWHPLEPFIRRVLPSPAHSNIYTNISPFPFLYHLHPSYYSYIYTREMGFLSVIILLLCLLLATEANNFIVGGKNGWSTHPSEDYKQWSGRLRFLINDTLCKLSFLFFLFFFFTIFFIIYINCRNLAKSRFYI